MWERGWLRFAVVGRHVDIDDLVGAAEIADRLDKASSSLIHDWRKRYPDFPKPLLSLRQGHLWSWQAVEAWAVETGRLFLPGHTHPIDRKPGTKT